MGKEDHRKSNLCYTFDGRLRGIAKLPENGYLIVHNDQRHKKTLGSGRSLATVFWSLSTAASDT